MLSCGIRRSRAVVPIYWILYIYIHIYTHIIGSTLRRVTVHPFDGRSIIHLRKLIRLSERGVTSPSLKSVTKERRRIEITGEGYRVIITASSRGAGNENREEGTC